MLKRLFHPVLISLSACVVLYLLLVILGVIRLYRIPTSSMTPTLAPGDVVVATIPRPKADRLQRGDLVIFDATEAMRWPTPSKEKSIHVNRVVALPGDVIEVIGGELRVNGHSLPTRDGANATPARPSNFPPITYPLTIPEGEVFMVGDHYNNSLDSRYFGTIPFEKLQMRPRFRCWPFSKIGKVN
jgi:signal peptidase I